MISSTIETATCYCYCRELTKRPWCDGDAVLLEFVIERPHEFPVGTSPLING